MKVHFPSLTNDKSSRSGIESEGHIRGAVLFTVSDCCAKAASSLTFTAPSEEEFQEYIGNLGVRNSSQIIIYDADSCTLAAARIWWMFRLFGHDNVSVLNGGFNAWKKAGYDFETGEPERRPRPAKYEASFRPRPNLIKSMDQIIENLDTKQYQLVDGRSGDLTAAIPGAINFPFSNVYDGKHLKSKEDLKELFDSSNIRLESPLVVHCLSGVASCSIALAAFICGNAEVAVYDGSWNEWKANHEM